MSETTLVIAFLAGLASFLSPCVFPLVPAFLGYLAGSSLKKAPRGFLVWNSFLFVLGFSAVFAIIGVLLNTLLSTIAIQTQIWLARIGGIIIIFFALYLLGIIKPKFLHGEHRFKAKKFHSQSLTSFVFGAAFAAGWSPCIGPVLGTVLVLAATNPAKSFALLTMYGVGLGLPFIITGIFADAIVPWIRTHGKLLQKFNIIVGMLLLILGILVFFGKLQLVANTGLAFLS